MSRFEKISVVIAIIGLSIQLAGLYIQFKKYFNPLELELLSAPIVQAEHKAK